MSGARTALHRQNARLLHVVSRCDSHAWHWTMALLLNFRCRDKVLGVSRVLPATFQHTLRAACVEHARQKPQGSGSYKIPRNAVRHGVLDRNIAVLWSYWLIKTRHTVSRMWFALWLCRHLHMWFRSFQVCRNMKT